MCIEYEAYPHENQQSHGSILIYFKYFNKKNAYVKCEYLQCHLFAYHYDQKEIDNVPKSQNSFKIFQKLPMHVFTQRFFRYIYLIFALVAFDREYAVVNISTIFQINCDTGETPGFKYTM